MTKEKIKKKIMQGFIKLKPEGDFDSVCNSNINEYIKIGIGGWQFDEADNLLHIIPNGVAYEDRPFMDILRKGDLPKLKKILNSALAQSIQLNKLKEDINYYLDELLTYCQLTNPKVIVYCCIWCSISLWDVKKFIQSCQTKYNINDLHVVSDLFKKSFLPSVLNQNDKELKKQIQNRAIDTLSVVNKIW